jgi:hypothetical protein
VAADRIARALGTTLAEMFAELEAGDFRGKDCKHMCSPWPRITGSMPGHLRR